MKAGLPLPATQAVDVTPSATQAVDVTPPATQAVDVTPPALGRILSRDRE